MRTTIFAALLAALCACSPGPKPAAAAPSPSATPDAECGYTIPDGVRLAALSIHSIQYDEHGDETADDSTAYATRWATMLSGCATASFGVAFYSAEDAVVLDVPRFEQPATYTPGDWSLFYVQEFSGACTTEGCDLQADTDVYVDDAFAGRVEVTYTLTDPIAWGDAPDYSARGRLLLPEPRLGEIGRTFAHDVAIPASGGIPL